MMRMMAVRHATTWGRMASKERLAFVNRMTYRIDRHGHNIERVMNAARSGDTAAKSDLSWGKGVQRMGGGRIYNRDSIGRFA